MEDLYLLLQSGSSLKTPIVMFAHPGRMEVVFFMFTGSTWWEFFFFYGC